MRRFTILMIVVTLPFTVPISALGYFVLKATWDQAHLPARVVAEERSVDNALAATVTATFRVGFWITPSCDAYSVHVQAQSAPQSPYPDGWLLDLPFDQDEVCEGPVSIQFVERRRLLVTVVTNTLEGSITRRNPDLTIEVDYRPRAKITPSAS